MKKPIVIGHRGAAAHAPENTLHSFQIALKMGADMIELDVHETNDGELVCMHDYDVGRTTNRTGLIGEMTLSQIKELDIEDSHKVPTLREVLEFSKGKIAVNIEIKVLDIEMKIAQLINEFSMLDEIIVSSFFHETLSKIKSINPKIKTAVLLNQQIENPVDYSLELGVDGINPLFYTVEPEMIELAHKKQLVIYPWTVNFEDSMVELFTAGVDGVITDYPDIARSVIDSRKW